MPLMQISSREDLIASPWWQSDTGQASGPLFATARYLGEKLQAVHDASWLHYMLYSREDARLMGAPTRSRPSELGRPALALNVVKSVTQTVQAQIIKGKIRPMFLTSGADWGKQRQIKKVDAFCQGAMYHAQVDRVAPEISMHALIAGTGIGKMVCGEDGKPGLEVVLPQEILCDPTDGARRNPRVLYHARQVARDALLEDPAWADKKDIIKAANDVELSRACTAWRDGLVDQVTVVEAWRLPSAPGAGNGRHVIAVDGGTLLDEEWCRSQHPFVFLRWDQRISGMFGIGIAQDLRPLQAEINRLLLCIQEQMLLAGPKVFIARGSQVNTSDLTNRIWDVIEYTGQEPKYTVFNSVAPEMFQQVDNLYQRCFDIVGVSVAASRGEKASGVTSGVAITANSDLQTGRMIGYAQSYEAMHTDIATGFLDTAFEYTQADDGTAAQEAAREKRDIAFTYPAEGKSGRMYLGQVSASEITLARDEYVCEVWPTSKLATAPGARLEQVMQLRDGGLISPMESRYLLDFPDLGRSNALEYAPYEAVAQALDDMLEDGHARFPEPWTDLAVAVPLAAKTLQRAQVDGVPEARWKLVAAYLAACMRSSQAQSAPPPGPPAADPTATAAAPAAAPSPPPPT